MVYSYPSDDPHEGTTIKTVGLHITMKIFFSWADSTMLQWAKIWKKVQFVVKPKNNTVF